MSQLTKPKDIDFKETLRNHLLEKEEVKQEKASLMASLMQLTENSEDDTERALHALLKRHTKPADKKAQKQTLMIKLYQALEKSDDVSDQPLKESLRLGLIDHMPSA
ncbi:hypothetical protein GCM10023116_22640 [Kistimonas scapharcae]|uniref:Uncharacterized protein n=1 Tax=Kistimonas scapharcae TaxID=1036133 RepID=A0ABP8V2G5_9GAMM